MTRILPEYDDIKDSGVVASFECWGNPYHGEVVNTTLTLPDASTISHAALSINDCFDLHVPDAPGGTHQTPDGGEWRDYLLLTYGTTGPIVYGKQTDLGAVAWLFARTDGSRWMVSLTSSSSGHALSSSAITLTFTATRFGEFRSEPEYFVFYLTLTDRGLGATIPTEITETLPSTVSIGISDVSARGDKCCLMWYATKTTDEAGSQRYPYAFFEVSLSDASFYSSSIALAYNIAAVAGTRRAAYYTYDGTAPADQCEIQPYTATASAASMYVHDSIMACWYNASGELVPIMFDYDQPLTTSAYDVTFRPSGLCTGDYSFAKYENSAFSVTYGDPVIGSYQLDALSYATVIGTKTYTGTGASYTETWDMTLDAGTDNLFTLTYSNSETDVNAPVNESGTMNYVFSSYTTRIIDSSPYITMHVSLARFHPWELIETPKGSVDAGEQLSPPELNDTPLFFAKRCSATLIAIGRTWVDRTSYERITHVDKFITKSGLIDNTYSVPNDITLPEISATVQPVTQAISIAADSQNRAFV